MRINKLVTLIVLFWLVSISAPANTLTKVDLNPVGVTLKYSHPVRLNHILADTIPHLNFVPYWLGAKLFDPAKQAEVDQNLQMVMSDLSALQQKNPNDDIYRTIRTQLKKFTFAYRYTIPLDPDLVRLDKQFNPGMRGQYILQVSSRPKTISVMGGVRTVVSIPFVATMTVADYLKQLDVSILNDANPSFAWIIYPDGRFNKVGYAYWNDQKALLIPGTILFLGFNQENRQHQILESRIVHLLAAIKGSL